MPSRNDRRIWIVGALIFVLALAALLVAIFYNPSEKAPPPTPPRLISAPRIAAVGDLACDPERAKITSINCKEQTVSDLLVGKGYRAFLPLGDNQYECASQHDLVARYGPTYGRFLSITRPVPGNHEYWKGSATSGPGDDVCTGGAQGYYNYFGSRAHQTGTGVEGSYTYTIGNWFFVAVNSECSYGAGNVPSCGTINTWIGQQLSAWNAAHSGVTCSLVYWHKPPYSVGTHRGESATYRPWFATMYNKKADILLNGHEHNYERWKPMNGSGKLASNGVREFVVGTGGKNESGITVNDSRVAATAKTFGLLQLTLYSKSYSWRFLPAQGFSYSDSGTGSCH